MDNNNENNLIQENMVEEFKKLSEQNQQQILQQVKNLRQNSNNTELSVNDNHNSDNIDGTPVANHCIINNYKNNSNIDTVELEECIHQTAKEVLIYYQRQYVVYLKKDEILKKNEQMKVENRKLPHFLRPYLKTYGLPALPASANIDNFKSVIENRVTLLIQDLFDEYLKVLRNDFTQKKQVIENFNDIKKFQEIDIVKRNIQSKSLLKDNNEHIKLLYQTFHRNKQLASGKAKEVFHESISSKNKIKNANPEAFVSDEDSISVQSIDSNKSNKSTKSINSTKSNKSVKSNKSFNNKTDQTKGNKDRVDDKQLKNTNIRKDLFNSRFINDQETPQIKNINNKRPHNNVNFGKNNNFKDKNSANSIPKAYDYQCDRNYRFTGSKYERNYNHYYQNQYQNQQQHYNTYNDNQYQYNKNYDNKFQQNSGRYDDKYYKQYQYQPYQLTPKYNHTINQPVRDTRRDKRICDNNNNTNNNNRMNGNNDINSNNNNDNISSNNNNDNDNNDNNSDNEDDENNPTLEFCKGLVNNGVNVICIHGRKRGSAKLRRYYYY